jgi:excisionase family DNA binding protein
VVASTRRKPLRQAKRYARLAEAAESYGMSVKTLRRYITEGRITGYRAGPKLIKVDLDELDAVLIRPIPAAR